MTTPISFILKGETLATIRYAQPKPFFTYATRAQKTGAVPCISSEQVMLGLVEALIERMAEALEKTGVTWNDCLARFPLRSAGRSRAS